MEVVNNLYYNEELSYVLSEVRVFDKEDKLQYAELHVIDGATGKEIIVEDVWTLDWVEINE